MRYILLYYISNFLCIAMLSLQFSLFYKYTYIEANVAGEGTMPECYVAKRGITSSVISHYIGDGSQNNNFFCSVLLE